MAVLDLDAAKYESVVEQTSDGAFELNGVKLSETATFIFEQGSFPSTPREPAA